MSIKLSRRASCQRDRILDYLIEHKRMTTLQAREKLKIMHPGARVMELRNQGHTITTNRRNIETEHGIHSNVAEYILMQISHNSEDQ